MRKCLILLVIALCVISILIMGLGCKEAAIEEITQEATEGETEEVAPTEEEEEVTVVEEDKPFKGAEITVIHQAGGKWENFAEEILPSFIEQTGINVKIVTFPWEQMHDKILTDLISGNAEFDLFDMSVGWESEFYEYLEILEPYIERDDVEFDSSNWPKAVWSAVGILQSPTNERYGLPLKSDTMTMFYRKDIIDELGLTDPSSWDWADFGEALNKISESGLVKYPFITAGVNIQLVKYFFASYLPEGKPLLDEDGNPLFNSQEGLNALEIMDETIFKHNRAEIIPIDNTEASKIFLIGDAAIHISWPYTICNSLENPDESRIIGKWGASPPPGPGNIGSQVFCMNEATENKEAAWEYMKWYTSPEIMKEVVVMTGVLHGPALIDEEVKNAVPGVDAVMDSVEKSFILTLAYQYPNGIAWFVATGESLGTYLSGGATAQETLDAMEDSWIELQGEYIGTAKYKSYFDQQEGK